MKTIDSGGQVYPYEQSMNPDGKWNQTTEPGISRRDWLAGLAMQGLLAGWVEFPVWLDKAEAPGSVKTRRWRLWKEAYAIADEGIVASREAASTGSTGSPQASSGQAEKEGVDDG